MFAIHETETPKFYCYYSNYAVALVQNIPSLNLSARCISPVLDFSKPTIHNVQQIYESLPQTLKLSQSPSAIHEAYAEAWRWFEACNTQLLEIFQQQTNHCEDVSVVLLGRPYIVLDPVMNQDIPQKFSEMGIKTFYQDMLPADLELDRQVREFIDWNHWKYGEDILRAAAYVAQKTGVYPVYLSAFKCSPDSFLLSYFREMMDARGKPYLILQIDEHSSDVGYSTRVESAVEAFRNHFYSGVSKSAKKTAPSVLTEPVHFGTILVPNYDRLSCSLICAALEKAGHRTRLIEETPTTVVSSLRLNDGQCMPVSAIVQGTVETIEKYSLDPDDTAILLSVLTKLACNLPQYPLMAKKLLEQRGDGYEKVQVIGTTFEMTEFPYGVIYDVYCAYLFGGLLRRMGCKLRPYEIISGQTDKLIEAARGILYRCIANGESKEAAFKRIVVDFAAIPVDETYGTRPQIAVIGDLYVRDNDVFNQQLIHELEGYGAEVITTPYSSVLRMLAVKHNQHLWQEGRYLSLLRDKVMMEVFEKLERSFFDIANEILCEDFPTFDDSIFDDLKKYQLSLRHGGETAQNIMKIFSLLRHYPDLSLFIHVNPIFCCPGLVSESMFEAIEKDIGIPIVSIVYDGTTAKRNEVLAPYVHYILQSVPPSGGNQYWTSAM
jgi:predicted nucleotide-binding protein (sugar kinase/HSP70/actin superfamily)